MKYRQLHPAVGDLRANALGRLRGFLRKLFDRVGDNAEAFPDHSRTGGFNPCVKRKQVGLGGDGANELHHIANGPAASNGSLNTLPDPLGGNRNGFRLSLGFIRVATGVWKEISRVALLRTSILS